MCVMTLDEVWERVNKDGPISTHPLSEVDTPCWIWTGGTNSKGYGQLRLNGLQGNAHRMIYLAMGGEIPPRRHLDHKCCVRLCVRMDHMRPLTMRQNVERVPNTNSNKTHCKNGHEFTESNTYIPPGRTKRQCRTCNNDASQAYKQRRKELV